MKRRKMMLKIKSKAKTFLLMSITVTAIYVLVGAMDIIFEQTIKGLVCGIISLMWLVPFGYVNFVK